MMRIRLDLAGLKRTRWWEYLVRFIFGALISLGAGLIAEYRGPFMGGLFLAFPAILPATLTLVEAHDGRAAAAAGAYGATAGGLGLVGFAACVWLGAGRIHIALALTLALVAWLGLSTLSWLLLDRLKRRLSRR